MRLEIPEIIAPIATPMPIVNAALRAVLATVSPTVLIVAPTKDAAYPDMVARAPPRLDKYEPIAGLVAPTALAKFSCDIPTVLQLPLYSLIIPVTDFKLLLLA